MKKTDLLLKKQALLSGVVAPARVTQVLPGGARRAIDPKAWQAAQKKKYVRLVKQARHALKMSQPKFADFMGISLGTVRNWEQRHRAPSGAARTLIQIAATNPALVLEAASVN